MKSCRCPRSSHVLPSLVFGGLLKIASLGVAVGLLSPGVARAQFESEIQAFEASDTANPPPTSAVLFVGSSTIRVWPELSTAFPGRTVLNRGFGGSQMTDVLFYFDRVVARYSPRTIVVYEGDNDLAAGKSVAQVFFLDFGGPNTTLNAPAPDDPINFWNNVTRDVGATDDGVIPNLVTGDYTPTSVSLVMLARFNGANENGTMASPLVPSDATRDSLFGNTASFNNLSNIFPRFKLTGLNPDLGYSFTLFASRMGVSDNRTTGYTVEGANTDFTTLDAANNVTNTTSIARIRPTAGGEITIGLAPTPANNNANRFTYLGALRIEPSIEPPQFLPASIVSGQVVLNWIGGERLERASTVLGPWTAVEPAPTAPYAEDLVPGEHRFYRLARP